MKAIPPEVVAAAGAVLDKGISANTAKEIFQYALFTTAVNRCGNETQAAAKLGCTRQYLNEAIRRLKVRLAS